MAFSSETSSIQYSGNDSDEVAYVVPFLFYKQEHLLAVVTDADGVETELALTTDYTVTGEADEDGGAMTTVEPWDNTYTLTITRKLPATQPFVFEEGSFLRMKTLEKSIDYVLMFARWVYDHFTKRVDGFEADLAAGLAEEAQARIDGDAALAEEIDQEAANRAEAIESEEESRAAGDAANAASIQAEETARIAADAALAAAIVGDASTPLLLTVPPEDDAVKLITDFASFDSNLIFIQTQSGAAWKITLTDPGTGGIAGSAAVDGGSREINVTLSTDGGGVIISTAQEVINMIRAELGADIYGIRSVESSLRRNFDDTLSDGTGIVEAMAETPLAFVPGTAAVILWQRAIVTTTQGRTHHDAWVASDLDPMTWTPPGHIFRDRDNGQLYRQYTASGGPETELAYP